MQKLLYLNVEPCVLPTAGLQNEAVWQEKMCAKVWRRGEVMMNCEGKPALSTAQCLSDEGSSRDHCATTQFSRTMPIAHALFYTGKKHDGFGASRFVVHEECAARHCVYRNCASCNSFSKMIVTVYFSCTLGPAILHDTADHQKLSFALCVIFQVFSR